MGNQESTASGDQHGATAETVGEKVLSVMTAPLAACCSTRAPARASVLLNSKQGELPVCNAAYKEDLHELQALASKGPGRKLNAGEKDADDNTPLHWAAVRGHAKATQYLVECDADVNFKNKDKDTPMHWACSGGNVEVIRLLLAAQADGLARNSDYTTPLHFAAADGDPAYPDPPLAAPGGPTAPASGGWGKRCGLSCPASRPGLRAALIVAGRVSCVGPQVSN